MRRRQDSAQTALGANAPCVRDCVRTSAFCVARLAFFALRFANGLRLMRGSGRKQPAAMALVRANRKGSRCRFKKFRFVRISFWKSAAEKFLNGTDRSGLYSQVFRFFSELRRYLPFAAFAHFIRLFCRSDSRAASICAKKKLANASSVYNL